MVFGIFRKKRNAPDKRGTEKQPDIPEKKRPLDEAPSPETDRALDAEAVPARQTVPAADRIPVQASPPAAESETVLDGNDIPDTHTVPDNEPDPETMDEPDLKTMNEPAPGTTDEAGPLKKEAAMDPPDNRNRPEGSPGLFSRLKAGLSKTRKVLNTDINDLFTSHRHIDDNLFDELEELLITADLGMEITLEMMERIRKRARRMTDAREVKALLKAELTALFPEFPPPSDPLPTPYVIMVVGVNGTGKTTTLGKLATRFTREKKKVLIAAADTFRAAAIEQVEIWAERAGAGIVKHRQGADPAAVAYDAVEAAVARKVDVLLIDTAGRLHTQKNLMAELQKIKRTVAKKLPRAPHDVLMVLDATTGQNAISQARIFNEAVGLTQLALTKLDGTAKGGIVAAVAGTMNLPIQYIGVGESLDDLQTFEAKRFVAALFD